MPVLLRVMMTLGGEVAISVSVPLSVAVSVSVPLLVSVSGSVPVSVSVLSLPLSPSVSCWGTTVRWLLFLWV